MVNSGMIRYNESYENDRTSVQSCPCRSGFLHELYFLGTLLPGAQGSLGSPPWAI